MPTDILRAPAEQIHAEELARLAQADRDSKPAAWRLSPRAVRTFILGDSKLSVRRKFYGDDALIDRCIVTLMSDRGLMLVGEPGTAKSMLSELLAAAISGQSTCSIQGTAGTTEDQIKYGWNYALLLAEGPTPRALVRGPIYEAMSQGWICRFEEVTSRRSSPDHAPASRGGGPTRGVRRRASLEATRAARRAGRSPPASRTRSCDRPDPAVRRTPPSS